MAFFHVIYARFSSFIFTSDIDECENHLCENGATCMDGVNFYRCLCPEGYTDTFCGTGKYIYQIVHLIKGNVSHAISLIV